MAENQGRREAGQEQQELKRLGEEIAELSACIDAATHRLLSLVAEFYRRSGWNDGACRSCAHWLSWRIGLDLGAAREKVRVARALEKLPGLSEALRRGEISYSKARAVTRVATPDTEENLLGVARAGSASQVEKIVRAWRQVDAAQELRQANRRHKNRYLQVYSDEEGMLVIRGRLTPEAGAALLRALEAAQDKLYRQRDPDVSAETGMELADTRFLHALAQPPRRASLSSVKMGGADQRNTAGQRVRHLGNRERPVEANRSPEGTLSCQPGSFLLRL
jgi:hypothetical protein